MTKKDVPVVHKLLREYLSQFSLVPSMNQEEVEHWLLPRENIIDTYLVEVMAAFWPSTRPPLGTSSLQMCVSCADRTTGR